MHVKENSKLPPTVVKMLGFLSSPLENIFPAQFAQVKGCEWGISWGDFGWGRQESNKTTDLRNKHTRGTCYRLIQLDNPVLKGVVWPATS